ncbi:High cysteine membrane protein [Giardia muris]|uniref:High cysteine membrane protein n=1 Tax=Giardia muris TaxID=5742 RepID=A0A4Z1SPL7_GIAMU|nr:High cysteine membrane protein [Giardia muris]|eukprot:TNJ27762.1 High cysteine membrane protein [Giardia muris]
MLLPIPSILGFLIASLAQPCYFLDTTQHCQDCSQFGPPERIIEICTGCDTGYVPINGTCVAVVDPSVAKAKCAKAGGATPDAGVCEKCGNGYVFLKGGCYHVNSTSPVCTATDENGDGPFKCTACGDGLTNSTTVTEAEAANTNACYLCDSTCKTCKMANNPEQCTACYDGYALTILGAGDEDIGTCAYSSVPNCQKMKNGLCTNCTAGYAPLSSDNVCVAFNDRRCGVALALNSLQVVCVGCNEGYSINGICVTEGDPSLIDAGCEKDPSSHNCTSCNSGYLLFAGGCYLASLDIAAILCSQQFVIPGYKLTLCGRCFPGYVPIDGSCTAKLPGCTENSGSITNCAGCSSDPDLEAFLFQGGCYNTGSEPGKQLCTGVGSGKCKSSAEHAFIDSGTGKDLHLCGDVENGGIANCETCGRSSTEGSSGRATDTTLSCTTCLPGFQSITEAGSGENSNQLVRGCVRSTVANCETPFSNGSCHTCKKDYLRDQTGANCYSYSGFNCVFAIGPGVCGMCHPAYTGEKCIECAPDYLPKLLTTPANCYWCPASQCHNCNTANGTLSCETCQTGYQGVRCELCEAGYLPSSDGSACYACGDCPNCLTMQADHVCSSCEAGYTGPACDKCAQGYLPNGDPPTQCFECRDCAGCVQADGANRCSRCSTNGFDPSTKCRTCSSGYIPTFLGDQCFPRRDRSCQTVDSRDQCLSCSRDFFDPKTDCTACRSNSKTGSDGNCYLCLGCEHCTNISGTNSCTACETGYLISNSGICDVCNTASGYFMSTSLTCVKCDPPPSSGCTLVDGSNCNCIQCQNGFDPLSNCERCPNGFCKTAHLAAGGTCVQSNDNFCMTCEVLGASAISIECQTDYVPIDGVCQLKTTALASNVCASNGNTCISCKNGFMFYQGGCYSSSRAASLGICASSFLIEETLVCRECRPGFVPIDGACTELGSILSRATINEVCMKADGTTPVEKTATKCENCSTDYFLFEGGCYPASSTPGTSVGSLLCLEASNGKCTTPASNAPFPFNETTRAFTLCPAGCGACSDATTCTNCSIGYYNSASGSTFNCTICSSIFLSCIKCTATACTLCSDGTVPTGNQSACVITIPTQSTATLSTGAIVGIVVSIIIVGGIGGLLVWRLGCRRY